MSYPPALARRPAPVRRAVVATVTALAAAPVVLGAAGPAHAGPAAPDVPSTIAVVGDFKPYLVGHAVGWQVHTCKATATDHAWSFDGPVATLHDDRGRLLASHSAGPSWTANDGSSVVGQLVDKVTVDAGAIPWLLLRAASRTSGPDGSRLAETTHIQRINTTGGLTPAKAECTAENVGEQRSVPYTADYVFWKQTGGAA